MESVDIALEDVVQCWKMLCKGASVLTISMGPEYPGLDDSVLLEGSGVPLEGYATCWKATQRHCDSEF
jgi:hypothetical protein